MPKKANPGDVLFAKMVDGAKKEDRSRYRIVRKINATKAKEIVSERAAWISPSGQVLYGWLYHDRAAAFAFPRTYGTYDREAKGLRAGWVRVHMDGENGVNFVKPFTEAQRDVLSLLAASTHRSFAWDQMDARGEFSRRRGEDIYEVL